MFAIVGHETSDSLLLSSMSIADTYFRLFVILVTEGITYNISSSSFLSSNEHNKFLLHKYLDRVLNIQTELISFKC